MLTVLENLTRSDLSLNAARAVSRITSGAGNRALMDKKEKVMILLKEKEVCSSSRKSHRDCYESLGLFIKQRGILLIVAAVIQPGHWN